jgi:putative transposase
MKERIREIVAHVAEEMHIKIENGVISSDHLHLFVAIPPHIAVCAFVQKAKGRSSRKIQQEFPELQKTYWGRHFWARGYFSATSGNVTDEVINEYMNKHAEAHASSSSSNIRLE